MSTESTEAKRQRALHDSLVHLRGIDGDQVRKAFNVAWRFAEEIGPQWTPDQAAGQVRHLTWHQCKADGWHVPEEVVRTVVSVIWRVRK